MKTSKKGPPKDIDAYLAKVPEPSRSTLQKLRNTIQAAAPKATEKISYGIPTFHYLRSLVAFAAFKNHCSFFPMNSSLIAEYEDELKSYTTAKGTIRFPIDKPLPASLVKKMVKARLSQNQARERARARR